MAHSIISPRYWLLKFAATLLCGFVYLKRGTQHYLRNRPLPATVVREKLQVPSREKGRFIGVDMYRPADATTAAKLPVIVNWHGSGHVIPSWGEDREFILRAVQTLGYVVLDADYRKGPEYTYPSSHDDAEDVVGWVLSQSERFDVNKVFLTGFSAGAGLALATGNFYGSSKVRAVSVLYPPIDYQKAPRPVAKPRSGVYLHPMVVSLFLNSYVPDLSTRVEPKYKIRGLETSRFPNHMFAATGDVDILHPDAKKYFDELAQIEKDKEISFVTVPCEDHGWDKYPLVPESVVARDDAYRQMLDNIKKATSN